MIGTTEARWFMDGDCPRSVRTWFDRLGEAAPMEERTDRYLEPTPDCSTGVKIREGRLEVKRRFSVLGAVNAAKSTAIIDCWRKWAFELAMVDAMPVDGWIEVRKRRLQRILPVSAPSTTVTLELGEVALGGATSPGAWTVCFEAAGPDGPDRDATLVEACRLVLTHPDAPILNRRDSMAYPEWLLKAGD